MGELGRMYRRQMVLRGFSEKTIESYGHAMVELAKAYPGISLDQLSKEQIPVHIVDLITKRKLAWSTVNVSISAFRLFYHDMLKRTDATFSLPPRKAIHRLPPILDRESVRKILDAHRNPKHRAILALAYGSGLRVSEICHLRPRHIESAPDRMMVRVEQGKGRKDRYTLLSHRALAELRAYWKKEHPGEWLFPRVYGPGPMSAECACRAYNDACAKAGVARERLYGIHTLRHCFASHLVEDGVALPVIQKLLGHKDLSTTSIYCHVSRVYMENVRSPCDRLGEVK